jgi:hypothetical protein
MREKLNENPMAQVGLIAVLLVAAAFLMMSTLKGGGSEEEGEEAPAPTPATSAAIATAEVGPGAQPPPLPAPGSGASATPPPPRPVVAAFEANQIVVVLFVRSGGIDDRLTLAASRRLEGAPGVAFFVVSADEISRYAAIAQGVNVNRVPALVVVQPKRLTGGVPTGSVQYGFQSGQSIVQAVVDAGYKGPTLTYHP